MMDYLAEVTMSIMQKQKSRDPNAGYARDFVPLIERILPTLVSKRIRVTSNGKPVVYLNELEWVKGEIYANVWMTDRIARIDPATGHVKGWIDLTGLFDTSKLPDPTNDVLNGIAYDAKGDRLFVTGKLWPKLFEIRLEPGK